MGMYFYIAQASESDLKEMRSDPEKVEHALRREGPEQDHLPAYSEEQLMLFGLPPVPNPRHSIAGSLDLDKMWHVLHFLMTGEPWEVDTPLSRALFGNAKLGPGTGYGGGPAGFLTPQEVREVTEALSSVTHQALRQRFSLERLNAGDIYPGNFEDHEIEVLIRDFDRLVAYYRDAMKCGNGMVMAVM